MAVSVRVVRYSMTEFETYPRRLDEDLDLGLLLELDLDLDLDLGLD